MNKVVFASRDISDRRNPTLAGGLSVPSSYLVTSVDLQARKGQNKAVAEKRAKSTAGPYRSTQPTLISPQLLKVKFNEPTTNASIEDFTRMTNPMDDDSDLEEISKIKDMRVTESDLAGPKQNIIGENKVRTKFQIWIQI